MIKKRFEDRSGWSPHIRALYALKESDKSVLTVEEAQKEIESTLGLYFPSSTAFDEIIDILEDWRLVSRSSDRKLIFIK